MERPTYNAMSADCPARQTLDLIADKWVTLVLIMLSEKTQRYSEMQRGIEGISKKMLTQTLRQLEEAGLITRTVYAVVPPKVEYNLTALGETLIPVLKSIKDWAEAHIEDVLAARKIYKHS